VKSNATINIHFLGAAGTVTGSKYLIELPQTRILVDCGLFQGIKRLRELNWSQLPVEASDIDVVLLTHGHLDHTGYLPRLFNMGFKGAVWGTPPTLDIAEIILRDSAKLQEEDAKRANEEGFSKNSPAKPLYSTEDVEYSLSFFKPKEDGQWHTLSDSVAVRFRLSGHILGASFIELKINEKLVVFSGDIGRPNDPLLYDPEKPDGADILFLESTYGDRLHSEEDMMEKLAKIVNETIDRDGNLIIPSFAVERAQLLMYMLWKLKSDKKIPAGVPVILDSPMGARALSVFRAYPDWHKLTDSDLDKIIQNTRIVQSFKETWEIIDSPAPKIVIAGSGMVTGGRVLTYLQQYINRPETTVLLAGFQAEGTRGRQLLSGTDEIKFYGKYHPVKARIEILDGLSAHADKNELLQWVSNIKLPPKKVYLVHGEPQALDMMRVKLKDTYSWSAEIPTLFQIVTID
jgi:metallo-beta-lactamase family protein